MKETWLALALLAFLALRQAGADDGKVHELGSRREIFFVDDKANSDNGEDTDSSGTEQNENGRKKKSGGAGTRIRDPNPKPVEQDEVKENPFSEERNENAGTLVNIWSSQSGRHSNTTDLF